MYTQMQKKKSHCSVSVYYTCTVSVCVYMCVSMSVMWDHVAVDSYSLGLYYVNVSLNYFVHRQKLGQLPSCAMSKKKKYLTHSFQMLSMQMFGRDENTPNVKRQKKQTISCFCRSLQATEYVHWIQKDRLGDGVVECSMFFVV